MPSPTIAALILNWNRWQDTERAARSLLADYGGSLEVIVIDNGSTGDDADRLGRISPDVRVIRLEHNHGFARAVNIAASIAIAGGARYLLLFNNDAYVREGDRVLEGLVARLESDATIGSVGPMIVNDDETVQNLGMRFSLAFPVPIGIARGRSARAAFAEPKIDYLMGSCLLVRAADFAAVDGMNPLLFFLGDDIDFMLRLKARGLRQVLEPRLRVYHRKSSSIKEGSSIYAYSALRSMLIVLKLHAAWWQIPSAYVTMVLISALLTVRSATSWRGAGLGPVLRAWSDFFRKKWGGFDGTWAPGYTHPVFQSTESAGRSGGAQS